MLEETNENDQSNDEPANEKPETSEAEETDIDDKDPRQTKSINEHELIEDNENNQVNWDYQDESESKSWSVSW